MAFEFDENTTFDGHKGTAPEPRRRGGRRPLPADEPRPEPDGANVDTAPEAAPPAPAEPPPKKPGLPRTGRYKPRPYRPERWGKGKKYAASGEWVPRFLKAYARTGNIGHAAYIAGVSRGTIGNWRERDPEFAGAVEDAFEWHKAQFDEEARRRAMEGDEIVVQDKKTGEWVTIRQKNPLYFFFYGKRIIPEYRDSYKPEDKDGAQAAIQVLVNVLEEGKRLGVAATAGPQPALPSFDDFKTIDITPPAETKEEERARLLARLAELDGQANGDDDSIGDQQQGDRGPGAGARP